MLGDCQPGPLADLQAAVWQQEVVKAARVAREHLLGKHAGQAGCLLEEVLGQLLAWCWGGVGHQC